MSHVSIELTYFLESTGFGSHFLLPRMRDIGSVEAESTLVNTDAIACILNARSRAQGISYDLMTLVTCIRKGREQEVDLDC